MKKTNHYLFPMLMLSAVLLVLTNLDLKAGDDNRIHLGERVSLTSDVLGEDRTILVYLPDSYWASDLKYPVLYLLDGGTHFLHASGITQFLSAAGRMPQTIVIAITNVDRSRDFSPTHVDNIPTSGGAEKFIAFLKKELIPFVDRNYRTSSYRMLAGHSFGGTFATYALLEEPSLFKGYIAISPYLMFDDEMVVNLAEKKLKSGYDQVDFFMTLGNEPAYFETLDRFKAIIAKKSPSGLNFSYTNYPEENHGSVPHLSIYDGLSSIFGGWKLPDDKFADGLAAIDHHYEQLSKKFGYPIMTPEWVINQLGYNYLNKNSMEQAIKVFSANAERYPRSANVYDSLGEAYEKDGKIVEAMDNYSKAVQIAEKKGEANLGIYKANLERTRELTAGK